MKKKKKFKINKKKSQKEKKRPKRGLKRKFLRKSIKKRKPKVKVKDIQKFKFSLSSFFLKIKPPSLTSIFSYITRPVFEAYYNFQKDRKKKLLKTQEAKEKEQERIKRDKFELIKKMKQEQLKEEVYYSKELKKDMKIFLREQERETRKQKAKQQQEIIYNLKLNKQIAAFEVRQNKEIADLEKAVYTAEKEDYQEVLDRIASIRLKYKNLRLESYRKKLQDLGIEVKNDEDKSALLEKERNFYFRKLKLKII